MPYDKINIKAGDIFGRLTVLTGPYHVTNSSGAKILHVTCHCNCPDGPDIQVFASNLMTGHTTSCGCVRRELLKVAKSKHGKSKSALYNMRYKMINRCHNPNCDKYKYYGGRGIIVCPRWKSSFINFEIDIIAEIGPHPGKGWSIDRLDTNGNYEPGNIGWANTTQQMRNKRNNITVMYKGESRLLIEVCEELGIEKDYKTIVSRKRALKWKDEDLFRPLRDCN